MNGKLIVLCLCIAVVMTGLWIIGHGIYCILKDKK
jgi:hypothetical protein